MSILSNCVREVRPRCPATTAVSFPLSVRPLAPIATAPAFAICAKQNAWLKFCRARADAPATYLLYVENDVDLLSAFHRDSWMCSDD